MDSKSLSMKFLQRIITEYCGTYAPDEDAQRGYIRELSAYSFTESQWGNVFNVLSRSFSGNGLPSLAAIRSAIHEAQAPDRHRDASRKGKLVFRRGKHEIVLIVQLESMAGGDSWVIASVKGKRNGETIELQRCPGVDAFAYLMTIPDAEFVGLFPDDSNLRWNHEIPVEVLAMQRKPLAEVYQFPVTGS